MTGGSTDKPESDVSAPAMFAALPALSVIVTPVGRLTAVIGERRDRNVWSAPRCN